MKLFGSKKKSRHTAEQTQPSGEKRRAGKHRKKNTLARVLVIVLAVLAALAIAAYAYWKTAVKPPDTSERQKGNSTTVSGSTGSDTKKNDAKSGAEKEKEPVYEGTAPDGDHDKYTFIVLGKDAVADNTDTIMAATFDATDYTMNVVSIPRDTLVNVSWSVKKINTLYAKNGEKNIKTAFSDILGFTVDFYAIVDLDAFIKLIDAIGGVYYDVPQDMRYTDPAQNLTINVSKGPQTLNGEDAMGVVRFRHTYAEGDIKRISVQQDFLKAAVKQILENVSNVPITTLADIVVNDVKTDLEYGNIIWFAKEMMKMDAENVTFQTLPGNYFDEVNGDSYVTIYVNKWLEMINDYLNPFDEEIEVSDLDILTRNSSGQLYATSGVRRGSSSWGEEKATGGTSGTGTAAGGTGSGTTGGTAPGNTGTSSGNTGTGGAQTETPTEGNTGTTDPPAEPTEPDEPAENPGEGTEEPAENAGETGEPEAPSEPEEPSEPENPDDGGSGEGSSDETGSSGTVPPEENTSDETQEPENPASGGPEETGGVQP